MGGRVKEFTVLLPKNKETLVTHARWLVLQVLEVALVGRTRLAHHLMKSTPEAVFLPQRQI